MPTIDLTPEQLHAHITGLPLRTGIYSDFNACMHRAGCQQTQAAHVVLLAEVEALRKDAERYRKWRADYTANASTHGDDSCLTEMLLALADAWTPADVDAAIDAAPAVGAA